jgi:hypothetical protein
MKEETAYKARNKTRNQPMKWLAKPNVFADDEMVMI